jgi:hypothetical protein
VIGIYVLWALNIVAILYSYYSSLGVILVSWYVLVGSMIF